MLLDERTELCDATSVVGTAGTATAIGDTIDIGSPGIGGTANTLNWPGNDTPVYLVIQVATQIITAGAAGLIKFVLVSDGVTPVVPVSATDHIITHYLATDDAAAIDAGIAAGTDFKYFANTAGGLVGCYVLPHHHRYKRYLGLYMEILTTNTTAGAINAFLTTTPAKYVAFADALPSGS